MGVPASLLFAGPGAVALRLALPARWRGGDALGERASQPSVKARMARTEHVLTHPAVKAGSFVLEVLSERGDSPGCRVMAVVAVDARSGERVSLGAAVLRVAWLRGGALLARRVTAGEREPLKRLEPGGDVEAEVRALRERHRGDTRAAQEAIMALYRERGVNPLSCWRGLVVSAAIGQASRLTRNWVLGRTVRVRRGHD